MTQGAYPILAVMRFARAGFSKAYASFIVASIVTLMVSPPALNSAACTAPGVTGRTRQAMLVRAMCRPIELTEYG